VITRHRDRRDLQCPLARVIDCNRSHLARRTSHCAREGHTRWRERECGLRRGSAGSLQGDYAISDVTLNQKRTRAGAFGRRTECHRNRASAIRCERYATTVRDRKLRSLITTDRDCRDLQSSST